MIWLWYIFHKLYVVETNISSFSLGLSPYCHSRHVPTPSTWEAVLERGWRDMDLSAVILMHQFALGSLFTQQPSCIAESCRDSASLHAVHYVETASLVRNRKTSSIDLVHLMRLRLKRLRFLIFVTLLPWFFLFLMTSINVECRQNFL